MREETSLLLEFRQYKQETLRLICETLMELQFGKKQKLIAEMLPEKITIQVSGDLYVEEADLEENNLGDEDVGGDEVEYYTCPPLR